MAENQSRVDHEAFLRLFTKFDGNLRAFAATLLPTWDGVDDVMQESSVVLWRKFSEFDPSGADSDFLNWAFMIVRYEVLRYRRRHATDPHHFSEDVLELLASEADRACATQSQRQLVLRECIKQLEPRQLALVKAVYEDGAAIKDVALQIGRSPTGLNKSLARIRDRLANCVRNRLAEAAEGLS